MKKDKSNISKTNIKKMMSKARNYTTFEEREAFLDGCVEGMSAMTRLVDAFFDIEFFKNIDTGYNIEQHY